MSSQTLVLAGPNPTTQPQDVVGGEAKDGAPHGPGIRPVCSVIGFRRGGAIRASDGFEVVVGEPIGDFAGVLGVLEDTAGSNVDAKDIGESAIAEVHRNNDLVKDAGVIGDEACLDAGEGGQVAKVAGGDVVLHDMGGNHPSLSCR